MLYFSLVSGTILVNESNESCFEHQCVMPGSMAFNRAGQVKIRCAAYDTSVRFVFLCPDVMIIVISQVHRQP